jgi:hypothetical protein
VPDGDERDRRLRLHLKALAGLTQPRPTDPYLGLTLDEAQALAAQEGRHLVSRTGHSGRRANLVTHRVNVTLDANTVVVTADWG